MTDVYVLVHIDYEEYEILGIYTTWELAEAEERRLLVENPRRDDLLIEGFPLHDS